MDISKMIRRATGDKKYFITTLCIAILSINLIIDFFAPTYGGLKLISVILKMLSLAGFASLVIYALNFHGTRGPKITLIAYFTISILTQIVSYLLQLVVYGYDIGSVLISLCAGIFFPGTMLLFVFLGIKGKPVYAVAIFCSVLTAFSVLLNIVRFNFNFDFVLLRSCVSSVAGAVLYYVIGHLVATDK